MRHIYSEHRAVFFGELKGQTHGKFNTITWIKREESSHLGEVDVESFQIQLVQVSQQRQSFRSWQILSPLCGEKAGAAPG